MVLHRAKRIVADEGLDRFLIRTGSFVEHRSGLREFVSRSEPLARKYAAAYVALLPRLNRFLRYLSPEKYTDADPFESLQVDPNAVRNSHELCPWRGWVVGGDWDLDVEPFFELPIPNSLHRRYVDGVEWTDPDLKRAFVAALEENQDGWAYSEAAYSETCRAVDDLYESVREEGYVSQRELVARDPEGVFDRCNDTVHPLLNEVGVSIGRDGEFLWNRCGKHRLAVARIVGVDSIPVSVYLRHREWQAVRDAVRSADSGDELDDRYREYAGHPDLADVWPG